MFIDNSSSRSVDWQMSNSCKIFLTRYVTSFMDEVVAFVSQYPKNPKGSVIWYGELLNTYNEVISEFECFMYFMDEDATLKTYEWVKFKV